MLHGQQGGPALTTARYYAGRNPARPVVGGSSVENALDWDLLGLDSEDEENSDVDEETKITKDLSENRLIGEKHIIYGLGSVIRVGEDILGCWGHIPRKFSSRQITPCPIYFCCRI